MDGLSRLPPRMLMLKWTGEGKPKMLKQKIILAGSKGSKYLVLRWPAFFSGTCC